MKKQLSIVNAISDLLDLKAEDPSRLDEDLIKEVFNRNVFLTNELEIVGAMGKSLKLRKENPSITKREIINLILE